MGYGGLQKQKLELAFAAGLNQRTDARSRPQPFLDICRDVQFDQIGGVQTRFPFGGAAGSIFGGGSIASARRIVPYGNEIVLFTSDSVYSWNAQLSAWVLRGTHLAVAVDERPRFVTAGDQIDGDRAELNGTVVLAWTEGSQVYAAAFDKVTESVLVAPTAVSSAVGRPRLVALATKILLFADVGGNVLKARAIDPAAPGTAIAGAGTTIAVAYNAYYDVMRIPSADTAIVAMRLTPTTSYLVSKVTAALSVAAAQPVRVCDGPIAIAVDATATNVQIVRANGTNIQGDLLLLSNLSDVFTAQAIGTVSGTPVNQVTAAFASTTCTAFWSAQETTDSGNANFATKSNTATTSNVIGSEAVFVRRLGVASRAFERGGAVYVWLAFGEDSASVVAGTPLGIRAQLQDTYFLYRADKLLVSKAVWQTAGGYSASTGHLPGVAAIATDQYAWAGTSRRVIQLSSENRTAFGARSPHDVVFTFDSNAARRCAHLGETLYVSGGLVQQYDGLELVELGFCVYPWSIAVQDAAAGNIGAGTYNWKGTTGRANARGERERSTTATGAQVAMGASRLAIVSYFPLYVTNKTTRPPSLEFWRTAVAAQPGSPYFLITGLNPNVTTGDNPYIPNSTVVGGTFNDNFADATLTTGEANPENDGVLEDLQPPGASIAIATDTRVFLAGVTGDPHRVWYSKQRIAGQVAAFHDVLTIDVPRDGGDVTSIAFLDETLFVFRATAIYALPGAGLDNLGQGQNFGPSRIVSLDVGAVNHESVALTPRGLIFKSSKGWQLLSGTDLQYIGDKVSDFDAEAVLAVNVVETQHQVRILTASRMLIWDYHVQQWGEWTITDGVHACMFGGAHVYLAASGTRTQLAAYTALTYGLDVEETWLKPNELQGSTTVSRVGPLGEYRSDHLLRLRMAYNYDPTYVDDVVWSPTPTVVGGPLQMAHGPKRQKCEAFKVRLTAVAAGAQAALATSSDFAEGAVTTSGTPWNATFRAKSGSNVVVGELGNAVTMAITFETGSPTLVDVRDEFGYDFTFGWGAVAHRVGVRVVSTPGSLTVAALETAIAAGSSLVELLAADPVPGKTIAAGMSGTIVHGAFAGGTFTAPTGEALKLTGLGLEVGVEPQLYRRLAAGQKA